MYTCIPTYSRTRIHNTYTHCTPTCMRTNDTFTMSYVDTCIHTPMCLCVCVCVCVCVRACAYACACISSQDRNDRNVSGGMTEALAARPFLVAQHRR